MTLAFTFLRIIKSVSKDHELYADNFSYVRLLTGLGHVRLSIIDVEHGKQPLSDETDTVHCVVNGELYDYVTIRADLELKGANFKTNSDSELVLQL
jgi:asparagine synthetase B (glutamine-hydrolysing)